MTLDLVIAVGVTCAAAIVIASLALSIAASYGQRLGLAAVLTLWFVVVVALAATGAVTPSGLGTPGVGIAVIAPIIVAVSLAFAWEMFRTAVAGIPLAVLIGLNVVRVLGVFFVVLYAAGRLPAPFAPSAGWGDIITGIAAAPVALLVATKGTGWRPITLAWNVFGTADLIAAIGLGVASAADSPFPISHAGPDTTLMAELPMFIIPAFLVPLLMLTHIAVFARLAHAGNGAQNRAAMTAKA
jgi:hypothetical protein